jgi:hypothetical protein
MRIEETTASRDSDQGTETAVTIRSPAGGGGGADAAGGSGVGGEGGGDAVGGV